MSKRNNFSHPQVCLLLISAVAFAEEEPAPATKKDKRGLLLGDYGGGYGGYGSYGSSYGLGDYGHQVSQTIVKTVGVPVHVPQPYPVHVPVDRPYPVKVR